MAFVHGYLSQLVGTERVVATLHELFPDAPIYILMVGGNKLRTEMKDANTVASFCKMSRTYRWSCGLILRTNVSPAEDEPYMFGCLALIFPYEEDIGITPRGEWSWDPSYGVPCWWSVTHVHGRCDWSIFGTDRHHLRPGRHSPKRPLGQLPHF